MSLSYWQLPGECPGMYEKLGVRTYKKYVPSSGDLIRRKFWAKVGKPNMGGLPEAPTLRERLEKEIATTKVLEAVHLGMAALFGYLQYRGGIHDTVNDVAWGVAQTGANVYPMMTQRYNRLRSANLLNRIKIVEVDSVDTECQYETSCAPEV